MTEDERLVIVDIVKAIDAATLITENLRVEWEKIKWQSIDKDNMEFKATVTTFQIEAINALLTELIGPK